MNIQASDPSFGNDAQHKKVATMMDIATLFLLRVAAVSPASFPFCSTLAYSGIADWCWSIMFPIWWFNNLQLGFCEFDEGNATIEWIRVMEMTMESIQKCTVVGSWDGHVFGKSAAQKQRFISMQRQTLDLSRWVFSVFVLPMALQVV